jgi:hypothetical protein
MAANRSPNYPAISLPEAIELLEKLYQAEKRSPADPEQAAHALGYNSMSGPARTKLSALRKYELVEDTAGGVRISDLGMTILYPRSPEERVEALRAAATNPALFRELASFPGASDGNLVSRLVRTGFTEAGAKLAVASFRKTMSLVPDEASGYTSRHESDLDMLARGPEPIARTTAEAIGNTNGVVVTLPGGARAELRLTGALSLDGLSLVRSYLDLLEQSIRAAQGSEAEAAASPVSPSPRLDANEPEQRDEQSPTGAPD